MMDEEIIKKIKTFMDKCYFTDLITIIEPDYEPNKIIIEGTNTWNPELIDYIVKITNSNTQWLHYNAVLKKWTGCFLKVDRK